MSVCDLTIYTISNICFIYSVFCYYITMKYEMIIVLSTPITLVSLQSWKPYQPIKEDDARLKIIEFILTRSTDF